MNQRIILIAMLLFLFSCQEDKLGQKEEKTQPDWTEESATNFVPGAIRIKLKPQYFSEVKLASSQGIAQTGISALDQLAVKLGASKIERLFRPSGKFEVRAQKAGLHLWYNVYFDEEVPLTRAASDLSELSEIDIVEPIRKIVSVDAGNKIVPVNLVKNKVSAASATLPFNDPGLGEQWHYDNRGTLKNSIAGADINLFKAWEVTTGSREVIVAVVDGGIDINHADLKNNVWHNEDEQPGNTDSDDNGYEGDVDGWNFVSNTANIVPHGHGTHVAGTVSAVNNNGEGVCGVAGGDGINPGVRVMSCQIFEPDPNNPEKDKGTQLIPAAIVYGADNGAVISQNSWSFVFDEGVTPTFDRATKAAIDYFITNAGMDENGNQVGPMKGGIVIFAAGNENKDYTVYPAQYEKVLSVASMAPDFVKAYYSNYADWVDVTAPGGSYKYGGKYTDECAVLSTYPDNKYAYMQGTSMACPHVSGIAALVVSKFGVGQPGLTPDEVKDRIVNGVRDIDQYNPVYTGKMGVGYVDAEAVLLVDAGIAPDPVTDMNIVWGSNSVTLTWSVTQDEDNGTPDKYNIYVSTASLAQVDLTTLEPALSVDVKRMKVGDVVTAKVEHLQAETKYYVALVGVDRFGNSSEPAFDEGVSLTNQAPVVTPRTSGDLILKAHETLKVYYDVTDPEGQPYTFALNEQREELSVAKEGDALVVTIEAQKSTPGQHMATLTVTDEPGASTAVQISYTVLPNHAPVATVKAMAEMYFDKLGSQQTLPLKEYFSDEDGEVLQYEISSTIEGLIKAEVANEVLTITSQNSGKATITIKASDYFGKSCSRDFILMSRDASRAMDLYPNPATDKINIRMGKEVDGSVRVKVYNAGGALALEDLVKVSPFEPGILNISKLNGGTYTLVAEYEGKEVKDSFIKL